LRIESDAAAYPTGATNNIGDHLLENDAARLSTLARYEERLARALAHVISVLDPDVIVLGGGLSNLDRLYENVLRLWSRYVLPDRVNTRLARNKHGDSSGVRGAAWLWDAAGT
jgi:predicted NBD/HSP70 family sugar kinase